MLYTVFSENRLTEVPCAVVSSQVTVRVPHIFCLPSCAALHKQDQINLVDFPWRYISLFKRPATFSWASDKPFERIGYCIFRLNVSSRKTCIYFAFFLMFTWEQWHKKAVPLAWKSARTFIPFVGILHVSSFLWKEQRALVLDTVPLRNQDLAQEHRGNSKEYHSSFCWFSRLN